MVPTFALELESQLPQRQLLEELYQGRTLISFRSGDNIPLSSQDIWVVCRGVVQLSTLFPSGDEVLLGLAAPSMPFGLSLTTVDSYYATALSDVDLMRLTLTEIEQSPALIQSLWPQINRRLKQSEAIVALVGHRRVRDRLCHLLMLLKSEIGQPVALGTRLSVRLTHQNLANAIGTTRVTVTRLLGQLRDEEWLTIDRHRYIILH